MEKTTSIDFPALHLVPSVPAHKLSQPRSSQKVTDVRRGAQRNADVVRELTEKQSPQAKMSSTMMNLQGLAGMQLKALIQVEISNRTTLRQESSHAVGVGTGHPESRKDDETQISFIQDPKLQSQIKNFN